MIWILLGGVTLLLMLGLMRGFSRASVQSIRSLLYWVAALAGVSLALLLVLTGRGGLALFGFTLLGPLIWEKWNERFSTRRQGPRSGNRTSRTASGNMTRAEAYEILGLKPGASPEDIKAAHRRLMAAAHPDRGGSDWIAARLNQARDVLLG